MHDLVQFEADLWDAVDNLRANFGFKAQKCSGLIKAMFSAIAHAEYSGWNY